MRLDDERAALGHAERRRAHDRLRRPRARHPPAGRRCRRRPASDDDDTLEVSEDGSNPGNILVRSLGGLIESQSSLPTVSFSVTTTGARTVIRIVGTLTFSGVKFFFSASRIIFAAGIDDRRRRRRHRTAGDRDEHRFEPGPRRGAARTTRRCAGGTSPRPPPRPRRSPPEPSSGLALGSATATANVVVGGASRIEATGDVTLAHILDRDARHGVDGHRRGCRGRRRRRPQRGRKHRSHRHHGCRLGRRGRRAGAVGQDRHDGHDPRRRLGRDRRSGYRDLERHDPHLGGHRLHGRRGNHLGRRADRRRRLAPRTAHAPPPRAPAARPPTAPRRATPPRPPASPAASPPRRPARSASRARSPSRTSTRRRSPRSLRRPPSPSPPEERASA